VAGSGKSTACQALQAAGCAALDIETIPELYELVDEQTGQVVAGGMDQITDGVEWHCNTAKLRTIIDRAAPELTIYCGGMSNTEEVWDIFDAVIVLTVSDQTTASRLATRRAGEFGSTKTNRDWVLSWKHQVEQDWFNLGGIPVSAEATPKEVAKLIITAAHQIT